MLETGESLSTKSKIVLFKENNLLVRENSFSNHTALHNKMDISVT